MVPTALDYGRTDYERESGACTGTCRWGEHPGMHALLVQSIRQRDCWAARHAGWFERRE